MQSIISENECGLESEAREIKLEEYPLIIAKFQQSIENIKAIISIHPAAHICWLRGQLTKWAMGEHWRTQTEAGHAPYFVRCCC